MSSYNNKELLSGADAISWNFLKKKKKNYKLAPQEKSHLKYRTIYKMENLFYVNVILFSSLKHKISNFPKIIIKSW